MEQPGIVYVVDDDEAVQKGLHWLFASVQIEVRAFSRAEPFLEAYTPERPACLLLDVRMPGMNGLELLDRITALDHALPVIMLSGHGDIPMALRAVTRGAIDFIPKPGHEQQILDRVQEAIAANARCLAYRARRAAAVDVFRRLSPREQRIMRLVAVGHLNKEVAMELGISERTVESHRLSALRKLQMRVGADMSRLVSLIEDQEAGHCRLQLGNWCPRCRAAGCTGEQGRRTPALAQA